MFAAWIITKGYHNPRLLCDRNEASIISKGQTMKVAVLGASQNPERYSNKAIRMLLQHKHEVTPVNPAQSTSEGLHTCAPQHRNV